MSEDAAPSLRQIYLEWIEDQIEDFKDSVSRTDLLRIADDACEELRVNPGGQYQLTEILLANAVDRKIFRMLKLPGYRTWARGRQAGERPGIDSEPPVSH